MLYRHPARIKMREYGIPEDQHQATVEAFASQELNKVNTWNAGHLTIIYWNTFCDWIEQNF